MTCTFYLKQPNSSKESLIYFSCYFKEENKKFVYSTGEKIKPIHWSKESNQPKLKGSSKAHDAGTINIQLGRYVETFMAMESECKRMEEDFTSSYLKDSFDSRFKKSSTKKNLFFDAYDKFMEEKQMHKLWKPATVKRYNNIKNHLLKFEQDKSYKLTFSSINETFYSLFTDFCYTTQNHYTNTLARNVGLFKTFMFWAYKNNYTYKDTFKEFKKPEKAITKEVALSLQEVELIFNFKCESNSQERVRDIFVFQCLTGLRYGEMKKINKRNVDNNRLILKEEKDSNKSEREVPLFEISNYILKKYDYKLPLISNQKQNELIKVLLKDAEFTHEVEYTRVKGVEQKLIVKPFYKRVSTHTARRTFITIMRNKGIADKTIMSITGHKDIKTFNMYHKVDNAARKNAVEEAFSTMELPKLKSI
ncbi:tyrosine-type recombinase/integrase [Psychroserpens luteus]|uniref:Tyrosine-type recombinase/integrase n=1 Tax=Psychroserpens luteus TaxID=1434066 RepID=A0ABW5ZTI9_9FLAO|nr:tyrosine-type recombinase/integrase [Psychroserpens luteus]